MKFNKMKLAALAMSALMAASTVSPAVYAADLFSDGTAPAEEVFVSDEVEPVAEETPVEEAVPEEIFTESDSTTETSPESEATPTGNADVLDPTSVNFHFTLENHDYTVDYVTENQNDGVRVSHTTSATAEYRAADCVNSEAYVLSVEIAGQTFTKEVEISPALNHHWVDTDEYYEIIKWPTHTDPGEATVKQICDVCNKAERAKPGDPVPLEKSGHVWGSPKYYVIPDSIDYDANVEYNKHLGTFDFTSTEKDDDIQTLTGVCEAVLGSDGLPVITSPQKKAIYYAVYKCTSSDNGCKIEQKTIYATESTQIVVKAGENIDTNSDHYPIKGTVEEYIAGMLENGTYNYKRVKLIDCTKPGSFQVLFYSKDASSSVTDNYIMDFTQGYLGYDPMTVEKHHWEKTLIVFKNLNDAKRYGGSGVNNSCLPLPYYRVTYCDNEVGVSCNGSSHYCNLDAKQTFKNVFLGIANGNVQTGTKENLKVVERKEETLPANESKHIINTTVRDEILTLVEKDSDGYIEYKDILARVKKDSTYVTVPEELMTATCTAPGTVTVVYRCKYCKKNSVHTQVIKVDKLGHNETGWVRENVVAATCTAAGSYDVVNRCKRCNLVLEKKSFTIQPLKHSNTKVAVGFDGTVLVDENGELLNTKIGTEFFDSDEVKKDGKDPYTVKLGVDKPGLTPMLYSVCAYCGGNKQTIKYDGTLVVKLDKISKEGKSCQPGSVTLTITYYENKAKKYSDTMTLDYYSSAEVYGARTAHDPGEVKREVIKAATETATGLEKVTTYCSICGGVIEEKEEVIPALGAKPVKPATPSISAASAGYDSINVSWSAVTGASGYRLYYRSAGTGVNKWKFIRVITGTSFTHSGLVTGEAYRYTVKAVVNGVQSDYSKTGAVARPMPAAPVMKSVTAVTKGNKVTWSKVAGATGYIVMRKTATGAWIRVATVKSGSKVTWTDKNAVSGASYKVRAYRTVNNVNYKGAFSAAM